MLKKLANIFCELVSGEASVIGQDIYDISNHITAHYPELRRDRLCVSINDTESGEYRLAVKVDAEQGVVDNVTTLLTNSPIGAIQKYAPTMQVEKMSDAYKIELKRIHDMMIIKYYPPFPLGF